MIGLEILQRNLQRFDWWDRPSHDVANRMSDRLGIITTTNELQSKQRVGIQLIGIHSSICDALPIEALRICEQDEVANMMEYNKKYHHHHHNRNDGDGNGDDNNDNISHCSPRRKLKKRRKKLKLSRQLINNNDDHDEVAQILEMKNNNNDGNYDNDNKGVGVKKKSNNDVDIVKSDNNNAKDGRGIVNNVGTSSNIVMANGKSEVKTTAVAAVNKVVTNIMKMTRQKDIISSYDNNNSNNNNSNNRQIASVVIAKQQKSMTNKPLSLATYYDQQSSEMKLQTTDSPSTLCMSFTDDDDDGDNYKGPSHGDEGVNTTSFVDEDGDVGDVNRVKTRPMYTTATTTKNTASIIKSVDDTLNDTLSISSYDHDINNNVNGMIKNYSWLKQVSATTMTADNANNAVKVINNTSSIVKQSDSLRNNLNKSNRKDDNLFYNNVKDNNNNHTFVGNLNGKETTIRKEQINLVTLQLDDNINNLINDHDNMMNKTNNRIQTPIRNRPKSAPSINNKNNITATINNNDYHHHQSNRNQIFTSTKFNDFPQDNLRSIDPRENSPFGLSGIGYVHDNGIKNLKATPNSWMNRVVDNNHDHDDGDENNENHGGITIIKEQPQTKLLNKGITNRIKGSNNNNNKKDDNNRKIRVENGRNMTFDEDSPQHIPIVTVELLNEYNHEEKKGEMNNDAIRYKKDSDVRFKVDVKKKKTRSSNDHPSGNNNNTINNSNNTSATNRVRDKDINEQSYDANAHNTTDTHGNNIQDHNDNNNSNDVKLSRVDQHKKIEKSRSEKESKRKENLLLRELKRLGVDMNKVVI